MLLELADGPRSQAQLAAAAGCEPPTITHSVRKLEAAGLVARRSSPTDARLAVVELSEAGERLLPDLREAWLQLAELSVAGLKGRSLDELISTIEELSASIRHSPTPPPSHA